MTVIVLNSNTMGNGNEDLGGILIGAFLKKVWARGDKPDMMVFYNTGVKLLTKEAGFMEAVIGLEEAGVEILACGTCLDHYDLRDKIVAGRVSNMEEIVNTLMKADKTITL